VVVRAYVPDSGDVIWLDFNPQMGREQAGRRPAVVVSRRTYNQKSSLAIVCPVTNQAKGYPFEVSLPKGSDITGVVLADQLKSLDWRERHAERAGRVSRQVMKEMLDRIAPLLGLSS
jgi:mRNA interferase MazF